MILDNARKLYKQCRETNYTLKRRELIVSLYSQYRLSINFVATILFYIRFGIINVCILCTFVVDMVWLQTASSRSLTVYNANLFEKTTVAFRVADNCCFFRSNFVLFQSCCCLLLHYAVSQQGVDCFVVGLQLLLLGMYV